VTADPQPSDRQAAAPRAAAARSRGSGRLDLPIVLLLLAVSVRSFWLTIVSPTQGIDYYQFWLVGQAQRRVEITDIYASEGRELLLQVGRQLRSEQPDDARLAAVAGYRTNIETFSTPLLYLAVGAPATGRYDFDFRVFQWIGLACVGLAVALLGLRLRLAWTTTALVLLVLFVSSDALFSNASVGNVNAFQLFAIAVYLWWLPAARTDLAQALAGAWLGLLVLLKPTLGLILPFLWLGWWARGRVREILAHALGAAVAASAAILVSSAWLGSSHAWLDWLAALPDLELVRERSIQRGNYAASRLILELGGPDVSLALALVAILGSAIWIWRANRAGAGGAGRASDSDRALAEDRDYLAVSLACTVSLVAFRLVWLHYFLLLVPLALFLLRRCVDPQARRRRLALWIFGLSAAAALGAPLRLLPASPGAHAVAGGFVLGSVAMLCLGLLELRARAAPGPRPAPD
jgi:hypothetical protein